MSTDSDYIGETRKILEAPDLEAQKAEKNRTIENLLSIPGARRVGPNKVGFDCPVSPAAQYIRRTNLDGKRL